MHGQIVELLIDKSCAWGFFDGAKQGLSNSCGPVSILFFPESNHIQFKVGLVPWSNNLAVLLALKYLLKLALEKGISQVQVFVDPLLIINWMLNKLMIQCSPETFGSPVEHGCC